MKNLVIVESPTKAKTIAKFLSKDYKITSSYGHLRDLPGKSFGVDVENNFTPKYVISADKKQLVAELKKMAAKAENIYFATDEDREGEAIAWHLLTILSPKNKAIEYKRIAFHEITKEAILSALKNPRLINQDLVDAQQARRVLDRLVGYKLSPFLWKKVARGLSAGRVQSVAVRLIVEREKEIKKFQAREYWNLKAIFCSAEQEFEAELCQIKNQVLDKFFLSQKHQVDSIITDLFDAKYTVNEINKKQITKKSPPPFTTSTLQQESHNKLKFSSRETMYLAQSLYEGIKIGREQTGLITYMRTDSLNLAETFINDVRIFIQHEFGSEFLPPSANRYKTKSKLAQEAHEAIRPTDINKKPDELKPFLDDKQYKLYDLIWRRSLACQSAPALIDATSVIIAAKDYSFRANGYVVKFPGWTKIYGQNKEDNLLPALEKKQILILKELLPGQHFTEPPPRYNDASLVKKMEELGIGRPSTYAPTISTIQARHYIKRESGRFIPQDIAFVVTDLLENHFPDIVDYDFTASMEDNLDHIAHGKKKWVPVIKQFYEPFNKNLEQKYMQINKKDLIEEATDAICEKCGQPMVVKTGRFGKFLACSGFPNCKNTKPLAAENNQAGISNVVADKTIKEKIEPIATDLKCEKCGSPLVIRQGKFGQFYACSSFPKCHFTKALDQDTGVACPSCGHGQIVAKKTKSRKTFYACDQYPKCKFALWSRPTGEKCPKCDSLMVNAGHNESKCSNENCK